MTGSEGRLPQIWKYSLPGPGLRRRRQYEEEFVSPLQSGADADLAAELRDNALNGGEAKTVPGGTPLMQTGERNEDALALLLRQRLSVVSHPEAHVRSFLRASKFDVGRRTSVLERIAQQVKPNFAHPWRITQRGRPPGRQRNIGARARLQFGELAQHLPDKGAGVERLQFHALLGDGRQQ